MCWCVDHKLLQSRLWVRVPLETSPLLQVLDDGDLAAVGVLGAEAVEVQAAVAAQGSRGRREGERQVGVQLALALALPFPLPLPLLAKVDGERALARRHVLVHGRVHAQLRRQLALDGGGALELVVDVDAQPPPRLFELRRDVGGPLGRVRPELPHLGRGGRGGGGGV